MAFIENPQTLKNSIRKYDLTLRVIESTAGYGECSKTLVYLRYARRGTGRRNGIHAERNVREAVLPLPKALPFMAGAKCERREPSRWLKSLAQ